MHNRFLMRQVDRDVLPLRVTLQHAFEREFAADAAFFVAAVGAASYPHLEGLRPIVAE